MDTTSNGTAETHSAEEENYLNETVRDEDRAAAEPPHSTPLHTTSSVPSFHLSPWKKFRRRRRKVHPTVQPVPIRNSLLSDPPSPPHPNPTPTHNEEEEEERLHRPSSPPLSTLTCSLPPLTSASLRKGGRRPSAVTDWSYSGLTELQRCCPDRKLSVFIGTWNMQQMTEVPESVDDFLLPVNLDIVPELYVIGTQETTGQRKEWEILLQQTMGPSYLMVHSASLGELCLLLFLRRDLIWFCSEVQSTGYSTRPGSMVKTKGGVGMTFSLFGSTFLFISTHLTAQQEKVEERNNDVWRITTNITKDKLSLFYHVLCFLGTLAVPEGEYDYVFWLGDLNYRLDLEREEVDGVIAQWKQETAEWPSDGWLPLLLTDQLTKEILQDHVFNGFSEQPILFPPSYKFDMNSDIYDSSPKQRVPSWTDRILFRSRVGSKVSGCGYNSCQSIRCSDHRPVYGVFRVWLKPCTNTTDGVPLIVTDFNRDVYRIALQRRQEMACLSLSLREGTDGHDQLSHRTKRHVTSSYCSIL